MKLTKAQAEAIKKLKALPWYGTLEVGLHIHTRTARKLVDLGLCEIWGRKAWGDNPHYTFVIGLKDPQDTSHDPGTYTSRT